VKTLKPAVQKVWRMPAVLNFTLGGMGSSLYIIGTFLNYIDDLNTGSVLFYKICSPILVVLGLYAVSKEAGRPSRARYLLRNVRRSWMSRETLAAYVFILSCFLDALFSTFLFSLLGLISGFAFLLSQAMIIYKARGLPAWNVGIIVPLFIISGIFSGSGIFMAVSVFFELTSHYLPLITLILLGISFFLWIGYLNHSDDSEFQFATQQLRKNKSNMLRRHALPVVLIAIFIITQEMNFIPFADFESYLLLLAGLMAVGAEFGIRKSIITQAGYYRQVTLYKKSNKKESNTNLELKSTLRN